nr:fatty-acid O-methyltransferase-like [Nerophis lumbriciformis]
MILKIFYRLTTDPKTMKGFWRMAYNFMAKRYATDKWKFMNYGYAPTDDPQFADLAEPDQPERYGAQMYQKVVDNGDELADQSILEVGCGRGGGCDFIHRAFKPKATTGLDLAEQAIEFCKKTYKRDGLDYVAGSADDLPFDEASFDAVVNVESSHTYPSFEDFIAEVHRVLKPGGKLYYVDFRRAEAIENMDSVIASKLTILKKEEITPAVVNALKLDHEAKEERIKRI